MKIKIIYVVLFLSIAASSAAVLPLDVVQADNRVTVLWGQYCAYSRMRTEAQKKIRDARLIHLSPTVQDVLNESRALTEMRRYRGLIIQAQQWDYRIRSYHHLPALRPVLY